MDDKRELLVFGYANELEKKHNINIPLPIKHFILQKYYDDYQFDIDHCGDHIKIIKKRKAIKKLKCPGFGHRSCIFGGRISSKQCNKFEIVIRWNKCCSNFYFGFLTSSIRSAQINWKQPIGRYSNKQSSVGILIGNRYDEFTLYDAENTGGHILDYSADDVFQQGDTFGFVFDFAKDSLSIFHNEEHATEISLNNDIRIIPAFSLGSKRDEEIEVIKCALL